MALPIYIRSPLCLAKRLRIGSSGDAVLPAIDRRAYLKRCPVAYPMTTTCNRRVEEVERLGQYGPQLQLVERKEDRKISYEGHEAPSSTEDDIEDLGDLDLRLPRSVQAVYLRPLKRQAQYGVPACDLQLRSYSVRNVEFFADFALRAAYYLNLPAAGPIPLPRITERWTVPRSNFIHKKSQENFERITLRRMVQIQDGHPDTVQIWLAFLRKYAYYGVGMKANVWEYEKLGVGKTMDVSLENTKQILEPKWAHFGRNKNPDTANKVKEMLNTGMFLHVDDGPFVKT